jgi:hypothetical protein
VERREDRGERSMRQIYGQQSHRFPTSPLEYLIFSQSPCPHCSQLRQLNVLRKRRDSGNHWTARVMKMVIAPGKYDSRRQVLSVFTDFYTSAKLKT